MTKTLTLALAGALALTAFEAGAASKTTPKSAGKPAYTSGQTVQHGLVWRCGKRNPAMWGTFGNGCLKQYRAWKKQRNQ